MAYLIRSPAELAEELQKKIQQEEQICGNPKVRGSELARSLGARAAYRHALDLAEALERHQHRDEEG